MRTHLRLATGLLATFTLAATVAACSSSGSGSGGDGSGVVPRSALAAVIVDVRSGKGSQREQALDALGRVPAFALATQGKIPSNAKLFDMAMGDVPKAHQLKYSRDVKPWLGDHAGAALLSLKLQSDAEKSPEAGFIAFADSTDDDKASAAMKRAIGTVAAGSAHGTKIRSGVPHANSKMRAYWAVDDGHVVVAARKADIVAALDAVHGKALEGTSDWDALTADHDGSGPAMGALITPKLFDTYIDLIDQATKDPEIKKAIAPFAGSLDTYRNIDATIAVRLGASKTGLWIDGSTHGELPGQSGGKLDTDYDVRDAVDNLPAGSVLGFAARGGSGAASTDSMKAARTQLTSLDTMMATAGKDDPSVKPLRGLLTAIGELLSDENLAASGKAFGSSTSGAIVEDAGKLGFYSRQALKDETIATDLVGRETATVDRALQPLHLRLAFKGSASDGTLTLSGIPAGKLKAGLANDPKSAAALARPLAAEWLVPEISLKLTKVDDDLVTTAPGDFVTAPGNDAESLSASEGFKRDIKAAGVPKDVDMLLWTDASTLTATFLDVISPQATPIVTGQLDHVGGPIAWSTHSGSGKDAESHFVLEIPLYK